MLDLQAETRQRQRASWLPDQTSLQEVLHERHHAARSLIIESFAESPYKHHRTWAANMAGCSNGARIYVDPAVGRVRPWLSRCRHRMCPFCAVKRSANVAADILHALQGMTRPRTIILTVRSNDKPLGDQLRRLRSDFARLRRRALWRNNVTAGMYTLEVTLNQQTGQWHPHLHIIYQGNYIHQKALRLQWQNVTGDSDVVWIEEVRDRAGAAQELAKYVGKPQRVATWTPQQILTYADAVNGSRMFQCFAGLHGVKLRDEDPPHELGPDTYAIRLSRIVFLAARGEELAQRLALSIAVRWPMFAGYIYHELPQLEPAESKASKQLRILCKLRGQPPPRTDAQLAKESPEILEAKLFIAFAKYHTQAEAGLFDRHDFAASDLD